NNGYYMPTGEDGMLFYPYSLVTPLNFHGTGASGVQVLHDITSSATVTLANPFAVTAGGTILGSVTAFTTSAGDRSSFQEQPEIPFAEVGEILADIRDSANSLTDMHDQLVSAGASLVQATAAALAELSNTLASAQAQVTTEQLDALEKMLSLKVEESVRLIASLDAGNRALNNATVDIAGASRQAAALLLIELAKLADAKLARQTELNVGYGAATDERSLQNTLRTLTQAAHSDNLTLILAIRNSAAAQRPDAWYEAANNALATAGSLAVDLVQLALSVVGAEQTIVGGIANGLNALISYARGDYYGAALDVAAAWPGAGAGHDAAGLARAFGRVGRTFGRFGRSVVNTAAAVNRRLDCHDANRLFSLMGKVLGRCFVGDTLVLIGEFELGQTVALIDPELSSTAPPLIAHEATAEADSSRWGWATMFLVVGVTGAILSRNRRRATISALRLPKPRVNLDPVDDPLPPPLTPEELTALCDELFSPTSDSVPRPSGSGQGSRHVPRDESRTPSDAHSPMTTSPRNRTSPSSSNMLALAEEPIMRYEPHQLAQPATTPRPSRARNIFASVWFTFFGLLAAWNFFGPTPQPATKHVVALPVIAAKTETPPALFQVTAEPKPRFAAKAIRDIHPIADRVIAKNPEQQKEVVKPIVEVTESELAELEATLMALADNDPLPALIDGVDDNAELVAFNSSEVIDEAPDAEPTKAETLANELLQAAQAGGGEIEWTDYGPFVRENWRVIHFLLTRPDGDLVRIWLARPTWWLEAEQVKAGGKYEFDMEEVGAVGMADVLSIDECQEPPRRQNEHHRLVTGKFEHEATNVIDLYVEGQDEPIGTTANHPFWSADRQAFVEAASLRPGENLLNAEGHRIQVVTHSARPGPQAVFNLEVDGTHVYHVSRTGCLVHNQCPLFGKKAFNTKIHHLVSYFGNKLRGFAANWSQKSQKILKAAGIDPKNSKWNQMHVPNHKGPHPQKYHKAVYERLKKAVEGKTPGSNGYQVAVRVALIKFARDLKNAKYRRSIGL
ncbi:MAG: polymorphic toxin-type HINT domain-containing protein, partial [Planctomycetaceae bacterium]